VNYLGRVREEGGRREEGGSRQGRWGEEVETSKERLLR
jgi:hypothetical protein